MTANGTQPSGDETDFFACAPGAYAALALRDGGELPLWDPADVAMLRDHALLDVCAPQMRGTWNQAASRASGTELFLHAFPELAASRPDLDAYVSTVLGDWLAEHTYPENAPGYNVGAGCTLGSVVEPYSVSPYPPPPRRHHVPSLSTLWSSSACTRFATPLRRPQTCAVRSPSRCGAALCTPALTRATPRALCP